MKNSTRPLIVGLAGAAVMAFASCSSTNSDNPEYVTYPDDPGGYGDYGSSNSNSGAGYAATNDTGGGGAYPTAPQNYGTDYGSDYGSTASSNTGGGAPASSGQTHTVKRGETLYRISRNYGTTVANIKAANGLTTDLIHPGDVLVVR